MSIRVKVTACAATGQAINDAAAEAINLAAAWDVPVYLIHNETEVVVLAPDSIASVVNHWEALRSQDQRRRRAIS